MGTTDRKGRLNTKKYQSGYDGINFQYKIGFDGIKDLDFEEKKQNTAKKSIVELQGKGGMISGYINPAHYLYADNRKPFGIVDAINWRYLKMMCWDISRIVYKNSCRTSIQMNISKS